MDPGKRVYNPSPQLTATYLSRLFFMWQINLFKKGLVKNVQINDLYTTLDENLSEPLADRMEEYWYMEMAKAKMKAKKPNLLNVIFAIFWKEYFFWGFMMLIQAVFCSETYMSGRSITPIILGRLIAYFSPDSHIGIEEAYVCATGVVIISIMSTMLMFHSIFAILVLGMRCRVACCSLVYRKMLRLNRSALGQTAIGQVINLISNDVSRFDITPLYLNYIWIMPIQAIAVSYFMWRCIGPSAFAGVAIIAIQAIPLQGYLSRKSAKLRFDIAQRTDERVRLMEEIISGINVIKMYAWEKPFEKLVQLARKLEIDLILITSYIRGFSLSLSVYTERLSLFATLISYILMGNDLISEKVFALVQFFNALQLYMAILFPAAIVMGGEALISILRLEQFLLKEETTSRLESKEHGDIAKVGQITTQNASASWTTTQSANTLHHISFNINPGEFCAIVGPVGSGKSSLLQLLINELPLADGKISIKGKTAYCSQEPWLFHSTVRNNILFGQPYDKDRYNNTIRVCALLTDFEQLPNGDKTLVGERGVTLSGGQKARINLARTIYRNADIYLMDDPLSAVDIHVGKHLFDKCILDYLSKRTRILVTHQHQFLKAADVILELNNGRITRQGTWAELSDGFHQFGNMNNQPHSQSDLLQHTSSISQQLNNALHRDDESIDLVESEEEVESGHLKWSVVSAYLKASGTIPFIAITILLLLMAQVASTGGDYWLTVWTNKEEYNHFKENPEIKQRRLNMGSSEMSGNIRQTTSATYFKYSIKRTSQNENVKQNSEEDSTKSHSALITRNFCITIYTILILCSVVLTSVSRLLLCKMFMNASQSMHNTMFNRILQAPMRFFDVNPSGRILNRFSKDIGSVDEILPRTVIEALQIFLVMFGILALLTAMQPLLVVAMFLVAAAYNKCTTIYLATAQDIKRLEGIARSPVFSHVSASFDGLATIRSCGAEALLAREFDEHQDTHTSALYLYIATSTAFGFVLDTICLIFMALVTFSFLIFNDGHTCSGDVGLAISQALVLSGMLQYGMRMVAEVLNQMTSVERVVQYTKIEKEGPFDTSPNIKPSGTWPEHGQIEFKHIFLKYSPENPYVLNDLTFLIAPGSKVGIVGRTGAGKSTLIATLFRLAILKGDILIDNISTDSVGLTHLRSRISIIPQTPVLFSGTLRYNLDPFGSNEDIDLWQALDDVKLQFITNSLDYEVQAGGTNFSAGQRQLLCLARAIIRKNKILVLDEATANVDPFTDSLIQTTIRSKFKSSTVLTIAHRLNTIMDCDKVLVMEAGCMVEYDHPHILLQQKDGFFSKMLADTGIEMEIELREIARKGYETRPGSVDSDNFSQ